MATHTEPMTAAALREAERRTMAHTPEDALMDRATAAIAKESGNARRVAVLAGKGNNGGDALLAGALLAAKGAQVTAILLSPDAHPRGLSHLAEAGGRVISWHDGAERAAQEIAASDLVIDGITGLGGVPGLRSDAQRAVAAISPHAAILAVDLPSGLDPDSPDASAPHVRADLTVTFTAPKLCLVAEPAAASAGRVVIADVGVDL